MTDEQKKGRGRPLGRIQDTPFMMRVTEAWLATIDEWREAQPPPKPHRSAAIRELVSQALRAWRRRLR